MKSRLRLLAACLAVFSLFFSVGWSHAAVSCGDGVVEGGEQCDGGPNLFIDGDPAKGTCTSGARCYYQFTCCKFNCQYVGTPGIPCQDGNTCTGPDTCDAIGACNGGPNAANDTPCDDGLFCTGTESCQFGTCTGHTGDPCPGTACNHCQEATDTCFDANGTDCNAGGDTCVTNGTCNGSGTCVGGVFTNGSCDDGVFCNGTDTCNLGGCSIHTGNPCTESGAANGNCAESCDEDAGACTGDDLDGSPCDDGLYCNGAADACSDGTCLGTGSVACNDNNDCTVDVCDEGDDSCTTGSTSPDGTACNDSQDCTSGDTCAAGFCVGTPPTMEDLCPWTVVLRENPKKDLLKTEVNVSVDGDVCAGTIKLSTLTHILSDLVSDEALGDKQIRLAKGSLIDDDIVTGGAGVTAYSALDELPYQSVSSLAPGFVYPKMEQDLTGSFDLTGSHVLAGQCHAARTSFADAVSVLDGMTATDSLASINVAAAGTQTITATVPGGLNVVDVASYARLKSDAVLELHGGGNANTVMVLRITGKLKLLKRSTISLTGGLTPDHVLLYVKGKGTNFSDLVLGAGTVFASPGKLKIGRTVAWVGALFADGKQMRIRATSAITHTPFTGF